ncbi:style cell-cycle inhibitor 1-A [Humulus lupulus]|uniref:style cell-cycle inhibitor 1-A n=1 Tax=Humulus lupulus TaxID=3486 RepID=UPI002B41866A|nr:style cell-cycle inhibitor 1-A [Humulus lupulus]
MGSERKSEKKQKTSRKRSSSPSPSQDEGRRKRHKSVEDDERKSRKSSSDKKEKLKDKKSHKRHSDKEKKSKDKHKDKQGKGDHTNYEFKELTKDDYFSKNNEFSTWLKDEKKIFFSDLSSEAAHDLFTDFIKAWNKHKLDSRYYEGIVTGPRTAHKWRIKV